MRLKYTLTFIALLLSYNYASSQTIKESVQELSGQAAKGMLDKAKLSSNGNLMLTYKMKTDKKSDVIAYEDYVFDRELNFKGIEPDKNDKQKRQNEQSSMITANVGGTTSFSVLSMKLNLQKEVWETNWDYGQQLYRVGKTLSREVVKPKNSEGKYKGYAAYPNENDGSLFIIASAETENKKEGLKYLALYVDKDLNLKETAFPVTGKYALVYCGTLTSGNIFAVLAPEKSGAEASKYIYLEYLANGDLKYNTTFTAPATAMAIMDYELKGDAVYFIAGSAKKAASYSDVFESYAPIQNPGGRSGESFQMEKYAKKIYDEDFENFHLLKFENGNLVMAGTTPVSMFKSKLKTPPSQRKGTSYNGKKLAIESFTVTPSGEYLVAGQLEDKKLVGNSIQYFYYDIVCLHFDANGNLKAQYSVDKINDDKKSEMFPSQQKFFFSADGSKAYWELLEVKGTKGYDSFIDAYNGNSRIISNYFPRIAEVNFSQNTVSDFKVLGSNGKFLLYKYQSFLFDETTKTRFYIGHDEDYKKLWVAKYVMQ